MQVRLCPTKWKAWFSFQCLLTLQITNSDFFPGAQAPVWVPLSLRASSFRSSEMMKFPLPMLERIPHHNCKQSRALRICVPKLEFGNKEQLA